MNWEQQTEHCLLLLQAAILCFLQYTEFSQRASTTWQATSEEPRQRATNSTPIFKPEEPSYLAMQHHNQGVQVVTVSTDSVPYADT